MPGMKNHIKLISKYMWNEKQQNGPGRKKERNTVSSNHTQKLQ